MSPRKRTSQPDAAPGEALPKSDGRPLAPIVDPNQYFFGESMVGVRPEELTGTLVVVEGMDGSGRSTQIALLQEWLESEGFPVQTTGLRRSYLVGKDIDDLMAKNAVTRMTLVLMYGPDFFLQPAHRLISPP